MRLLLFIFISVTSIFCARAQDVEFSQYLNNPVYLNPGLAGSKLGPRFIVNYRNQWPQLGKGFVSYSASYDQHFDAIGGGAGFQVLNDNIGGGYLTKLSVSANYNYVIKLSDKVAARAGMQVAFIQNKLDINKLLFYDQFSSSTALPTYPTTEKLPDNNTKTNLDIGAGAFIYGKKGYFGVAFKHINQPNLSFYPEKRAPVPIRALINLGVEFKTKRNGKTYISPNIMYTLQSGFKQLHGHVMLTRGPIMLGAGLRNTLPGNDAFIIYAGIKYDVFRFMYSYDNTTGTLGGQTGGSHEFSLSVNLSEGKKANKKRTLKNSISCPQLL